MKLFDFVKYRDVRLLLVVLAGCSLWLLSGCVYDKAEPEYTLAPGDALPAFYVQLLSGEVFDSNACEAANLIIVFFNTGCSDCQHDLPLVQELYDSISGDPATRLLCIAREEDAASISAYWADNGLTLPVAPQPDRRIYNLFASSGIPRVYLAQSKPYTIAAAYAPGQFSPAALLSLL